MSTSLYHGDCLDVFSQMKDLDSIVSDPPSGIGFMGLKFDLDHGGQDKWVSLMAERFAVAREACKPGSYGLFWSLPRTIDWTMSAIRKAGYRPIDVVQHVFGQGWPKAKSQLKPAQESWILCRDPRGPVRDLQIDRCRVRRSGGVPLFKGDGARRVIGALDGDPRARTGETSDAGSWPPDVLISHAGSCREVGSRKVAASHGTTGVWRGGGKLYREHRGPASAANYAPDGTETVPAWECLAACTCGLASLSLAGGDPSPCPGCGEERWWACPVAELDGQSGTLKNGGSAATNPADYARDGLFGGGLHRGGNNALAGDSGGASRFYPTFRYDAKASDYERQAGCEGDRFLWLRDKHMPIGWRQVTRAEYDAAPSLVLDKKKGKMVPNKDKATGNVHATIKPIGAGDDDGLMRWLVRLVTPTGGRVGDPFLGSGSTAVAAQIEGHDFIGCDIDPGAVDIARARTAFWTPERHREELLGITARREAARKKAEEERAALEARGQRRFGW